MPQQHSVLTASIAIPPLLPTVVHVSVALSV
jgi:hypothetical protein